MELIPTEYKIKHDFNEYVYYIVLKISTIGNKKWFITMYDRNTHLNHIDKTWSDWVVDWYGFDTPEEALEAFEKYLKN